MRQDLTLEPDAEIRHQFRILRDKNGRTVQKLREARAEIDMIKKRMADYDELLILSERQAKEIEILKRKEQN